MNEESWYSCTNAVELLNSRFPLGSLNGPSTLPQPRKLRLYFVACADRLGDALPPPVRTLVRLAEALADEPGLFTREFREEVRGLAGTLHNSALEDAGDRLAVVGRRLADLGFPEADAAPRSLPKTWGEWLSMSYLAHAPLHPERPAFQWVQPAVHNVALVHDIFDPFRRLSCPPEWRTSAVVGIARKIYDLRTFEDMSVLVDALMDANCCDERILAHCRGDGRGDRGDPAGGSHHQAAPHVRGCWVLDMLLCKRS